MEYRKIIQFNFKNKKYQLLLDNKNKQFFLGINDDGNYSYITIEELIALNNLFKNVPKIKNAEKNHKPIKDVIRIIPKVIVKGTLVTLTLSTLLTGCFDNFDEYKNNYYNAPSPSVTEKKIDTELSFEVIDSPIPLEIDTFLESDWLNYLYIYDMDYLDKALPYETVTIFDLEERIQNNNNIPDRFKKLLTDYVNMVNQKYPNADLRVLYENLKTLEIVECTKNELILATLSVDSYGCYVASENKIYVNKDYEYTKGTWEYQVIMHELGHALRTGYWNGPGNKTIRVQSQGLTVSFVTLEEALNSLFTVSLFDYEERDIAYQLQSNYYGIMLECMNNYGLADYVNHSSSYFLKKLDEYTGYSNYAVVIAELIDTQYKDYHSDTIAITPDQYRPIYEYISDMYYDKYITDDMTYSEARLIADTLIERITFDVPIEYNIDIDYIYEYFDNYCALRGINLENQLTK